MSSEARRIAMIRRVLGEIPAEPGAPVSSLIGVESLDDCAVLGLGSVDIVIGADFVRGTRFHLFELGLLSWEELGWFVMGANASDLAAMGATPLGATLILRYTPELTDEQCESLMRGVAKACKEFRMPLIGGDTGGFNENVLSATAFGICAPGTALLRSQGRAAEKIFVTGPVGRAGAAIAYFRRGKEEGVRVSSEVEEALLQPWRRVEPALMQGIALRENGWCRCAIDTSDGLKASVRQLAEASGLDVVIDAQSVPLDPIASAIAKEMGVDPLALCVGDSVDFRLVFSVAPSECEAVREYFRSNGWDLFEIGEFKEADDTPRVWLSQGGKLAPLPGIEWSQSEKMAIDELRLEGGRNGGSRGRGESP